MPPITTPIPPATDMSASKSRAEPRAPTGAILTDHSRLRTQAVLFAFPSSSRQSPRTSSNVPRTRSSRDARPATVGSASVESTRAMHDHRRESHITITTVVAATLRSPRSNPHRHCSTFAHRGDYRRDEIWHERSDLRHATRATALRTSAFAQACAHIRID